MGLVSVLTCFVLACFMIGSARGQSITIDTNNLCSTYQYRVRWNGWTSGQYILVSSNLTIGNSFFKVKPNTTEGEAYLYLIPSSDVAYMAQLIAADSQVISQGDFTAAPCQTPDLRTFGLAPELQAIIVLNHFRANNSLTPVFYNSLLETVAGLIAAGNVTTLGEAFALLGKSYDGTASSIDSQGTAFFDAGSLVQSLLLSPQLDTLSGGISEVGFSYSQQRESWVLVLGTRTRVFCSDAFVAGLEKCDDGNREDGDGCSAACQVESGWTCSEDILQEGSVCSLAPVDVPESSATPSDNNGPTPQAPIAQNHGSVTQEAGTLALLLALTAVVLSF